MIKEKKSFLKIVKESKSLAESGFDVMFVAKVPGENESTATLMFGSVTEEVNAYLCAWRVMRNVKKQFESIGLVLEYKISRAEKEAKNEYMERE